MLPPFHQTGLRPFLASYRLYTYSRAYSILNNIWRRVFTYFFGLVLKNGVLNKCPFLMVFDIQKGGLGTPEVVIFVVKSCG